MKNTLVRYLFWVVIFLPAFIWIMMEPLSIRFNTLANAFRSFGQIDGLTGMTLFSVNIILSSRLKFLDKFFYPLNIIYKRHHLIGGIALIMLLFHPIFLLLNYLVFSLKSASLFIIPSLSRPDVIFGEIALGIMIVVLFITFYTSFAYEIWKKTHRFLGLAFFLAFIHIFLVSSDISSSLFLKAYMVILAMTALIAYFYRSIAGDDLVGRSTYVLDKVGKLNSNYFELSFNSVDKTIDYYPGQFVFIKELINDKKDRLGEEHPFSIASSPKEKYLKLVIKNLGDFTNKISDWKKGLNVKFEGPFGRFSYYFHPEKDMVWIAGGVGITPFLGMIKDLELEKKNVAVSLFYSFSDDQEIIYERELREWEKLSPKFQLFLRNTKNNGRLTAEEIKKKAGDLKQKTIFICGPKPMMRTLSVQFVKMGIEKENIVTEEFDL